MNTKNYLFTLLFTTLMFGCELIDLGDTVGDDDDGGETGDDDGDESNDDETGDAPNDDGGETGGASNDDDPAADTSGDPSDPSDPSDPNDPSAGETGDPSVGETIGSSCEDRTQACLDDLTLEVCDEGESIWLDCHEACIESGFVGAIVCGLDEESGVDVCWCDDGTGGGEGGGA